MALVGDLELASFDYTDPDLKGERFHTAMKELAAEGWLAAGPYGYVVFDREAGEFFLRTRSAIFPGMKIAELFEVTEGPLWEEMKRNILHINGTDHTRLRSLVNPSLSPRAVERWRPAMRSVPGEPYSPLWSPPAVASSWRPSPSPTPPRRSRPSWARRSPTRLVCTTGPTGFNGSSTPPRWRTSELASSGGG